MRLVRPQLVRPRVVRARFVRPRLVGARLAGRRRPHERLTATVLRLQGFCPECGRELQAVRGTVVGAVEGECPDHGHVDDALTA